MIFKIQNLLKTIISIYIGVDLNLAPPEENRSSEVSNSEMDALNRSALMPVNAVNQSAANGLHLNRGAPVKRSAPLTKCKPLKRQAQTFGSRTLGKLYSVSKIITVCFKNLLFLKASSSYKRCPMMMMRTTPQVFYLQK